MFHFPTGKELCREWLRALKLENHMIKDHHRICSHHGDKSQLPDLRLGIKFVSPKKVQSNRYKRALKQSMPKSKQVCTLNILPTTSSGATPMPSSPPTMMDTHDQTADQSNSASSINESSLQPELHS